MCRLQYGIMRKQIRFLLILILTFCGAFQSIAMDFSNETLRYVITYKWGLVNKEAGDATLTLKNNGNFYDLKLTGKTRPWADKFYNVRDTLSSRVAKNGFRPQQYVKIAHEGGRYAKDDIRFSYAGNIVGGKCQKYREKNGKTSQSEVSMTATGSAFDMLSIFYFLRTLDYSSLTPGKIVTTSIFSGSSRETVKIRNIGSERIKLRNGKEVEAFHIRFNFTSDNGKKSSDDIDAWLSADSKKIPLKIIGKLPIGSVRVYLVSE